MDSVHSINGILYFFKKQKPDSTSIKNQTVYRFTQKTQNGLNV